MLYLIIGLFIAYFIEVYKSYILTKEFNEDIHLKEILNVFKSYGTTLTWYVFSSLILGVGVFLFLGFICGMTTADYNKDKPVSVTYDLKKISEEKYFSIEKLKGTNDRLINLFVVDDGMLSHKIFNENDDNVKYQLKDCEASVTFQTIKKVEPSLFEKVWYLKGILDSEEKNYAVIITIPNDSELDFLL